MPSPGSIDLIPFLRERFADFGIETPVVEHARGQVMAVVTFDDSGFVITCAQSALIPVKAFLDATFDQPLFNSSLTAIYRNDACFTTVMFTQEEYEVKVIVLHWKNPDVRAKIERMRTAGIEKAVNDECSEVERLIEEASRPDCDLDGLQKALDAKIQELESFLNTNSGNGDGDAQRSP